MEKYKKFLTFFLIFICIDVMLYLHIIFTIKKFFIEFTIFFIFIPLYIIMITLIIIIIIGIAIKLIYNKSRKVVKIKIDKLSNDSPIFKCGYCGATDSFLIPFLGMNLFQCSHCRRYNILEEQANNV